MQNTQSDPLASIRAHADKLAAKIEQAKTIIDRETAALEKALMAGAESEVSMRFDRVDNGRANLAAMFRRQEFVNQLIQKMEGAAHDAD